MTDSTTRPAKLPRPNDTCWCGSGKKYKKCHSEADAGASRAERQSVDEHRVLPGRISPHRSVPAHIPRPDYAESGVPGRGSGRLVRTPEELVRLRRACHAAATLLRMGGEQVKPGVTTDAIDAFIHQATIDMGGYPSTLNYRGYPKSLCTSVNEIICHGIPDDRPLRDGDIVNLDITIYLDGMHGDTNATFFVGEVDEASKRLVRVTHECMMRGIEAVKPGVQVSAIGRAIEAHAKESGYSVVRSYCGHGISDVFHANLQIPHYDDGSATTRLEPGMTFTIEPMINMGSWRDTVWDDGWTAVTRDLKRSAQFEHTVLVTDTGVEILTVEA